MGACYSLCMDLKSQLAPAKEKNEDGTEKEVPRSIPRRIMSALFSLTMILFFLYFFLVGLSLMGDAFKVLAGDTAGSMFSFATNPFAGLCVGILVTVLVQSSSTTTSIIVAAVGSGALEVQTAIPMIFGANIGTSVTNTIVSIGFAGDLLNYERAFAGATVHDIFNIFNVILWMILESVSNAINSGNGGILFILSDLMVQNFDPCDKKVETCEKWVNPFKTATKYITSEIISVDKDVIKDFSRGRPDGEMCNKLCEDEDCDAFKFYRKACAKEPTTADPSTVCGNEDVSKKAKAKFSFCSINNETDVIEVDEDILKDAQAFYDNYKLNKGGAFAGAGWSDEASGTVTLIISLILLIICLVGLVKMLNYVIRGAAERWIKRALDMNGYLAILVGCGVTMMVQSSSITTSILTPLVAVGVLTIEKMVPLTFGANIGTTFTGVLAALVSDSVNAMQIALVHVLFNCFGVITWYPIECIRRVPINCAKSLGRVAARFRPFPTIYVFMCFGIYPLLLLGLSVGFEADSTGAIVGTTFALLIVLAFHFYVIYWYKRLGGRERITAWLDSRNMGFTQEQKDQYEEDRANVEGHDVENTGKIHHEGAEDENGSTGSVDISGGVSSSFEGEANQVAQM